MSKRDEHIADVIKTIAVILACVIIVVVMLAVPGAKEDFRAWYAGLTFEDVKFIALIALVVAFIK